MMKLGCLGALPERGSHFIRDLAVEVGFFASGQGEGTWAEGTSPTHQVNAGQRVSSTLRHGRDDQSGHYRCHLAELASRDVGQGI